MGEGNWSVAAYAHVALRKSLAALATFERCSP
jgi:hypothetical protein